MNSGVNFSSVAVLQCQLIFFYNRIPRPLSFQTVRKKLNGAVNASKAESYKTINEFLIDVRTIFGNFVWFNYHPASQNLRRDVCRVLYQFESSWFKILEELVKTDGNMVKDIRQPLPELKACLAAFDDMVKVPPIGVPGIPFLHENS